MDPALESNRPILRLTMERPWSWKPLGGQVGGWHVGVYGGRYQPRVWQRVDLGTAFTVEHSVFRTSTVGLEGNLGYATGTPDGVIRASFSRPANEGWTPTIA